MPTTSTSAVAVDSVLAASIEDHAGDVAPAGGPPWADLIGARIELSRSGFELRMRLGGGAAPDRAPDDNTMNLASFFDIDDDGAVDYEIWANLGPDGWGASYYDDVRGEARHLEDSFVTVEVQGDEVVLRFARLHLDGAERFRWSTSSEWGSYDAIGTDAMVRDQAPDAGATTSFPGS